MPAPKPLSQLLKRWSLAVVGILAFSGFILLGNWQLERREWKLDLIQRVNERAHASPQAAPSKERWPVINKASDEYRRGSVNGHFLPNKNTLVVAASELGSGYWVITPFKQEDGSIVLINRGFINQGVEATPASTEYQQIIGLLRISEPDGSAVRDNDPDAGRWYSRDVATIAAKHKLSAAPYFIDAEKNELSTEIFSPQATVDPVAGLTVIRFHNSHLVYAITWYSLALMVVGAAVIIVREEKRANLN